MHRALRRMVALEDYFEDEETRRAYSYDASGAEGLPAVIVRPRHNEQLRRILVHANRYKLKVIPRGSGTGTRAGAVRKDALIIDMRGFDTITRLDTQLHTVDVGAGVTVAALARALEKKGYHFPLVPANSVATIGGLAATNHVTEESQLFGDWNDLVERAESFDGLGRFHTSKGKELDKVLGKEGTTGVLVTLRLKITKQRARTLDVFEVDNPSAALSHVERLSHMRGVLSIEYLDAAASQLLGLDKEEHLLVAYTSDAGGYKDIVKVESLLAARKRLTSTLWSQGYTHEIEASLEEEQIERFAARCKQAGQPCYGHIGLGIMLTAAKDTKAAESFRNGLVSIGAMVGGKHGYGRLLHDYVPDQVRKDVRKLKEERDYNEVLNPGVIV